MSSCPVEGTWFSAKLVSDNKKHHSYLVRRDFYPINMHLMDFVIDCRKSDSHTC